jgi:hypothetical protein
VMGSLDAIINAATMPTVDSDDNDAKEDMS